MSRERATGHAGRRLALLSPLFALTGCTPAVLSPRGPVGLAEKTILFDSLAIMLVIVIPTIVATFAIPWWFRASNGRAHRRPDWVYSGSIELLTWGIPLLTITLLGGVTWIGAHKLDPGERLVSDKPALEVQVVSLDWKWLFIYPGQQIATVNELFIPAGTPVHFTITSASVMNAFFIPQLGSMIYTMNGMASQLNLQADAAGEFRGLSSHFSGDGFSDMHFQVYALKPEDFDAWVKTVGRAGPILDEVSYARLARQSINDSPTTFSKADPMLFDKIVTQVIAPAPGPQTGKPDVVTSSRTE